MSVLQTVFSPVTILADTFRTAMSNRAKRKNAQIESDIKLAEARAMAVVESIKQGDMIDAYHDQIAQEQMNRSWKDEWVLIFILTYPYLSVMCPITAPYTEEGMRIISEVFPSWYSMLMVGTCACIYGFRRYLDAILAKTFGIVSKTDEMAQLTGLLSKAK